MPAPSPSSCSGPRSPRGEDVRWRSCSSLWGPWWPQQWPCRPASQPPTAGASWIAPDRSRLRTRPCPTWAGVAVFAGRGHRRMGRSPRRPGAVGRCARGRGLRRPLRASGAATARGPAGCGSDHRRHPADPPAGLDRCPTRHVASVVLINGFNLLDGLDMLCAGVGAAAAVGLRRRHPRSCTSHGRRPDRGSGRVPLVQPSPGPHLSGGRRLLPPRGVHDRAPHRRVGLSASPVQTVSPLWPCSPFRWPK